MDEEEEEEEEDKLGEKNVKIRCRGTVSGGGIKASHAGP